MRKRLTVTIALFFFISLILFLNNTVPLVSIVQGGVQKAFEIPKSFLYRTSKTILPNKTDEISRLKEENKKLSIRVTELEKIRKDNEAYQSQFAQSKESSSHLLPAEVIGFEGKTTRPTKIVVNRGVEDGVKVGMVVVFEKNLVGKIDRVGASYSVVVLPISTDFTATGKTVEDETEGIITGQNDFILFDHILITDPLKQGDIVVTKGSVNAQGIGLPPGVVVGKVKTVSKVDTKPFQTAEVESLLSFNTLTKVFIEISGL